MADAVTPLKLASIAEHLNSPNEATPLDFTQCKGKDPHMKEEVNDQRSQESSELWERRLTTIARSPNHGRNRAELADRRQLPPAMVVSGDYLWCATQPIQFGRKVS